MCCSGWHVIGVCFCLYFLCFSQNLSLHWPLVNACSDHRNLQLCFSFAWQYGRLMWTSWRPSNQWIGNRVSSSWFGHSKLWIVFITILFILRASIKKGFLNWFYLFWEIGGNAFSTVQSAKNRISFPVSWGVNFPMDGQFTKFFVDGLVKSWGRAFKISV